MVGKLGIAQTPDIEEPQLELHKLGMYSDHWAGIQKKIFSSFLGSKKDCRFCTVSSNEGS